MFLFSEDVSVNTTIKILFTNIQFLFLLAVLLKIYFTFQLFLFSLMYLLQLECLHTVGFVTLIDKNDEKRHRLLLL